MPLSTAPTVNPYRISQPPGRLDLWGKSDWWVDPSDSPYDTSDEAWGALALESDPVASQNFASIAMTTVYEIGCMIIHPWGETGWQANAGNVMYTWYFYSGTCYFQLWWNEVLRTVLDSTGVSTLVSCTARNWSFSPMSNAGLCLPGAYINADDASTWIQTDVYSVDLQRPANPPGDPTVYGSANDQRLNLSFENIRWSFIDGYTPPDDGSASGFPAF